MILTASATIRIRSLRFSSASPIKSKDRPPRWEARSWCLRYYLSQSSPEQPTKNDNQTNNHREGVVIQIPCLNVSYNRCDGTNPISCAIHKCAIDHFFHRLVSIKCVRLTFLVKEKLSSKACRRNIFIQHHYNGSHFRVYLIGVFLGI